MVEDQTQSHGSVYHPKAYPMKWAQEADIRAHLHVLSLGSDFVRPELHIPMELQYNHTVIALFIIGDHSGLSQPRKRADSADAASYVHKMCSETLRAGGLLIRDTRH